MRYSACQVSFLVDEGAPGQHLDEHQASGIHVHRRGGRGARRSLRRHVGGRAARQLRIRCGLQRGRHAKVHHQGVPVRVDHDVGRLEIAVHDARLVGGVQAIKHIHHKRHGIVGRAAPLLGQVLGQRASGHVLEHDVGLRALHIGLKHRHDAGVSQTPHVAGLAQPLLQHGGVLVLHGAHQLDGHLALQARVQRQPHGGLDAPAQLLLEFKPPQRRRRLVA